MSTYSWEKYKGDTIDKYRDDINGRWFPLVEVMAEKYDIGLIAENGKDIDAQIKFIIDSEKKPTKSKSSFQFSLFKSKRPTFEGRALSTCTRISGVFAENRD